MSKSQPHPNARPAEPPSEALILAALDRAVRHRERGAPTAPIWAILEHLAVPRRSAEARRVRAVLEALRRANRVEVSHPHGVEAWALTLSGRRRLRRAERAGTIPSLPESPQHREWRSARALASQELERFSRGLREQLNRALLLLDADEPAPSDTWFELAEVLRRDCRRLGSASHCLHEWLEPHDQIADLDDHIEPDDLKLDPSARDRRRARRMGRRNVRLWRRED